jgi:hypothetical protein
MTGEIIETEKQRVESTFEDVSLHAMKCTLCGERRYYSSAGRIVEEEGVSLDRAFELRATRERKEPKVDA